MREALNYHLKPDPIVVLDAATVAPTSTRGSRRRSRHYLYRILARNAPPALDRNACGGCRDRSIRTRWPRPPRTMLGRHDFTTFRAAGCQAASPVKTLDRLDVTRRRRGNPHRGLGSIVPASSGALARRQLEARRRGQVDARRHEGRARGARPQALRRAGAIERALPDGGRLRRAGSLIAGSVERLGEGGDEGSDVVAVVVDVR